jgi:hypothetical protein
VPDEVCAHFKALGDYDYRPAREVAEGDENTEVRSVIDVDILGHIFEQSITDLERLRLSLEHPGPLQAGASAKSPAPAIAGALAPSEGERDGVRGPTPATAPAPAAAAGSVDETQARKRRKQEGAVYTPAFITRYIVGQALGGVLKQRFEALRQQHEAEASRTARKSLADPNAYDLTAFNEPQRIALIRFWEAWQDELKRLRILDPACGSGAILIEAFNQLHAVYDLSNARLEELRGQRTLFDLDHALFCSPNEAKELRMTPQCSRKPRSPTPSTRRNALWCFLGIAFRSSKPSLTPHFSWWLLRRLTIWARSTKSELIWTTMFDSRSRSSTSA